MKRDRHGRELVTCNSLWIGGDLGPVSAACLASFLRHGHPVVLYCYEPPRDVPYGVGLADAAAIIPSNRILRHKETGSYALFANLFRYELLRRGLGLWIDCDVFCVRPFDIASEYVYGWQQPNVINNAVLGLPRQSPVLERLIDLFETKSPVPAWLGPNQHAKFAAKARAGEEFGIEDLPWGAAGPGALTYLLTESGLASRALPETVFYPISFARGYLLLKKDFHLAGSITPRTLAVHLWNEGLVKHLAEREPGSAIDRLLLQGSLFDEARLNARLGISP